MMPGVLMPPWLKHRVLRLNWVVLVFLIASESESADPTFPRTFTEPAPQVPQQPGEKHLPEPGLPPDRPSGELILPLPPQPSTAQPPLSYQVRVWVRSIRIQGSTVLPPEEVQAITAPYVGRFVTTIELQELRRKLTLSYIDKGYITSGVILPDQKVTDGTILFRAVEGVMSDVDVVGTRRLRPDYIRERLDISGESPLNTADLQEQLQLLKLDPNVELINGQLRPGRHRGESVLTLTIEETAPFLWSIRINNHRSPSVGSYQGEIHAAIRNVLGRGDVLSLRYQGTEGIDDGSIGFTLPLRAPGPILHFGYRRGESEVIEEPFNELDVESEFDEWSLGLTHSVIRRLSRTFDVTLSLDKRRSETFRGGLPFTFSSDVLDPEHKVTVIRLIGHWLARRENQVVVFRSTLSKGIDAFDATIGDDGPDGRFLSWLGQFQYVRRFGKLNNEFVFRTDIQLSSDALLPLEKFGVGGAHSVRGYRENELVRDNAVVSSVEMRIPILRDKPAAGRLQLALFADYGNAWNKGGNTLDPRSISSAGVGLRWSPRPAWYMELYGAIPFRNLDHQDHDLQDSGVHFEIIYQRY